MRRNRTLQTLTLLLLANFAWAIRGNSTDVPFEAGETVRYEVNYKPLFLTPAFKAGELEMKLNREKREGENYRISAWVRSGGLLKSLAGLDVRDYMESTMDAVSLTSISFLHQVRTNRKQQDITVAIDRQAGRAQVRVVDVSHKPPKEIRSETFEDIPADVSDYLSAFYRLRARPLEVGAAFHLPLSENGKLNEVSVKVLRTEEVKTPLGKYAAVLIATEGGLFRGGGDLRVWFSIDEFRVPVKFEADVRFGRVFGHLIELQTPQMTKSLIRPE